MNVENICIDYVSKSGMASTECDKICHTKVLPYLSVVQSVEGSYGIQLDNGDMLNTGSGGFFIAPSNVQQHIVHNVDPESGKMVCRWVFLKVRLNGSHYLDDLYSLPTLLPDCVKAEMNDVFDRLFDTDNKFDEYVYYHQIIRLLSKVSTEKNEVFPPLVDRALCFIKENYRKKLTVEDIAKSSHLSPSYLFSIFKKQMGISPIAYLNNYRLSIAADHLLQDMDKPISQIASEVGVCDRIYFNKAFKKQYQMSPTDYRRLYR